VPSPVRNRIAVVYAFAMMGVTLGSWASRNADMKARVGASKETWTLILLAGALGALVGVILVRRFAPVVGVRRFMLASAPFVALLPAVYSLSHSAWALALGLFANGIATGSLNTPMNASAVSVERRYGRPIMASFHGWFSIGLLAGAGISALCAGIALHTQMLVVGVVLLAGFVAFVPSLPREGAVEQAKRRPLRAISPQLYLLAAIAMCSSIGEGGATQWSSVYVHQSLHTTTRMGAVAYFVYSASAATNRLLADRVLGRLGRRRFIRSAGIIAATGTAAGLLIGTVPGAFVMLVFMGIGFSAIVPTVFGAAGNEPGYAASEGIATVALLYWPAFLLGPALLGSVASAHSVRVAFLIPVATALTLSFLARWVRELGPPREGPVPVEG
jgi:MFS family permease